MLVKVNKAADVATQSQMFLQNIFGQTKRDPIETIVDMQ